MSMLSSNESKKRRRELLWRKANGKCYYCGGHVPKHLATTDHAVPRALGGANSLFNLVMSCRRCNSTKSDMPPHKFIMWQMAGLV